MHGGIHGLNRTLRNGGAVRLGDYAIHRWCDMTLSSDDFVWRSHVHPKSCFGWGFGIRNNDNRWHPRNRAFHFFNVTLLRPASFDEMWFGDVVEQVSRVTSPLPWTNYHICVQEFRQQMVLDWRYVFPILTKPSSRAVHAGLKRARNWPDENDTSLHWWSAVSNLKDGVSYCWSSRLSESLY